MPHDVVLNATEQERYAAVLVWALVHVRKQPFRKHEFVQIRFDAESLPLAEETAAHFLERGLEPVLRLLPTPRFERDYYAMIPKTRLGRILPGEEEWHRQIGGSVTILAPSRLDHLSGVSSERLNLARCGRASLSGILRNRETQGVYAWTLCLWPTQALADRAGMTLADYAAQVRRACFLDEPDPVARWKETIAEARRIAKRLTSLGNCLLHVESAGTDLRMRVGEARKWIGISGRNIPSFEVYVSPDWRTVEGRYTATLPSFHNGNIVRGAVLTFKRGRVASMEADAGQDFARTQISLDKGASQIGEFALVDRRFSRIDRFMATTLYDENHGGPAGSMHIALGQSYHNTFSGAPEALDVNALGFSASALHWDLISTEDRRVTALDSRGRERLIYENGRFVL